MESIYIIEVLSGGELMKEKFTAQQIENEKQKPTDDYLKAIANLYGKYNRGRPASKQRIVTAVTLYLKEDLLGESELPIQWER